MRNSICYDAAQLEKINLTNLRWGVKIFGSELEGYPSGQRDQTVNLTALPSKVRILLPPPKEVAVAVVIGSAARVIVLRV